MLNTKKESKNDVVASEQHTTKLEEIEAGGYTFTEADRKNRFFASRAWYAAALAIILWAIFQEIIMACTDIVDNIFVNSLRDDQVNGLLGPNGLSELINASGWNNFFANGAHGDLLTGAGLSLDMAHMHYSAAQLAVNGVTASNQMYTIMYCMVSGFCYGCGIYSAQYFGAGDYEKLRQVTALKMYVIFIITGIFALLTIPQIGPHLIEFTTQPKETVQPGGPISEQNWHQWYEYIQYRAATLATEEGYTYFRIIATSYILLTINETAITTLRETRRPFVSFWMSLISVVVNCILNLFLTAPGFLGDFKGLGVQGTAIATYCARIVQLIFIVTYLAIKKYEFIPRLRSFVIEKAVLIKSMVKAFPILINELLFAFALMIQVRLKGQLSFEALTANAIFATVTSAILSPMYHGLNAGISVFVGNSLGANKLDEAERNARYLLILGWMIAIVAACILVGLAFFVPHVLFSEANETAQLYARWMIVAYAVIYPFQMIANATYSMMRAGGSVIGATIMDGVFNWAIEVPLLAIMVWLQTSGMINLGEYSVVWIHIIVSSCEILKAILGYLLYSKKLWVRNLTLDRDDATQLTLWQKVKENF